MSEMGRDAAHVVDRAGEIAQQVGGELDKAYSLAKGLDWAAVTAIVVVLTAVGIAIGIAQVNADTRRTRVKLEPPHPAPGDPGYLDWANQTGPYTSLDAKSHPEPSQPFRW